MTKDRLRAVYDLESQAETDAYYTAWAATYDEELTRNGYRSPQRCAEALARFVGLDTAVLDVGCGTGISGAALAEVGYTNIAGHDVNAEMLERAKARNIYRELWVADKDDPFPFEPGSYGALAAIGVIGVGAAPASLLGEALGALASGGHLVFSYNDHARETAEFADALTEAVASGTAEEVFAERGPHFEALDSSSTVYVLRKK
jgi:predicted TPR repeat methyltransferase